jgi:hypothetical protein
VLAVEIHQNSPTSTDISFDLALVASGDFSAPTVTSPVFHYASAPMSIQFTFSENVAATLSAGDLLLENLTTSAIIPTANMHVEWIAATKTAVFTFPSLLNGGVLPDGRYRATLLRADVKDAAGNPLAADSIGEFFFLSGDLNHDAMVDMYDFYPLMANWGMPSNYDYLVGDFNYDGFVNEADLGILASRWQVNLSPAPTTLPTSLRRPQMRVAHRAAPMR